ncbi:tumor necrosis factor receptor superfamily member 18 isoform X3 [Falco biarmicus]|uniref:tumor necrosis factor receptor superfamily member 18 isoform X3 n=3 Tax=Falco TaxID=8952 RepID=UPI0024BCA730|nr:tumor necrosis factor receptor superfamily member 18 isoform X3 [Falco biarmicus]
MLVQDPALPSCFMQRRHFMVCVLRQPQRPHCFQWPFNSWAYHFDHRSHESKGALQAMEPLLVCENKRWNRKSAATKSTAPSTASGERVLLQGSPDTSPLVCFGGCIAQDMTEQTSEVSHIKIRACLLLVVCLWQWTQQTLATPCQDGELRIINKYEKKCCPKCSSSKGDNSICQNIEDHDCRCRQGYSCIDNTCLYCKKLPECAEGEELVKLGILDFTFKCKPCEIGTYSNVKNGWCRNWTDCESSGFLTIKQGNSTHNAICGFPAKDLEQAPVTTDSLYTTILAILTAVAVFVLILLTFFLHFCIWSLKKEKYHMADGCRGLQNCHTLEKRLTAASFQKKNTETKHQKKSLATPTLRANNENR